MKGHRKERLTKYKVYFDPRKEHPGPAVAIKGPKGTRRVQLDGKAWKIDGRKNLGPYEKANSFPVYASSYGEARKKAHEKFRK